VRWVNGFAERHGELGPGATGLAELLCSSSIPGSVELSAADGTTAVLEPFAAGGEAPADGGVRAAEERAEEERADDVPADDLLADAVLAGWAMPPARLALILVRRGGYAVGLGQGPELIAHKVGTRYVQSRTAAGGWSQHRFARRRDKQADALVASVIEHTRRVVLALPASALVVGGDRTLVRDVLADPRLAQIARLPRRELFDLPDPRLDVLKQALRRGRAVRILLTEAATSAGVR
jgi:hypothetical protein